MTWTVQKSQAKGRFRVPPSKSHTMRAILFASMANGCSRIQNWLRSPDVEAMIAGCKKLGARIEVGEELVIEGVAGAVSTPDDVIDAGNSGQVLRFLGALAALGDGHTVITGDHSIRHRRPVGPMLEALRELGAEAISTKGDGRAPIVVGPRLRGGSCRLRAKDSQLLSGLLMASPFAEGETHIECDEVGERPWVLLTLDWMERMGLEVTRNEWESFSIPGGQSVAAFDYVVPGDWSSAAFGIALGLMGEEVILDGLQNDSQGDRVLVQALQSKGANIEWKEGSLHVRRSQLQGGAIDVNDFIDAVPILVVLGTQMKGGLEIVGAGIAREKESDRIGVMTQMLQRMGAKIEEYAEGMWIEEGALTGAGVEGCDDHRVAMALTVAGMIAEGKTVISGVECVKKSFPEWQKTVAALGGEIQGEKEGGKRVWLVGLPAVGKTSLGRAMAAALQVPFWDTDEEMEKRCGMSCKEFMRSQGEARFRELEKEVIEGVGEGVIAVGGGGWVQNRLDGVVIRVDGDRKVLWERIQQRGGHSLAKDWESFNALCDQRESVCL